MQVGREVESVCGKCGNSWHVVIALADGRIAKVECRECGARHRHRPVGGAAPAARRRTTGTTTRVAGVRAKKRAPVIEADLSRPARSFSIRETYQVGDRVVHPNFGQGVVQTVLGPTKVEVLFGADSKTLVQGRGAA